MTLEELKQSLTSAFSQLEPSDEVEQALTGVIEYIDNSSQQVNTLTEERDQLSARFEELNEKHNNLRTRHWDHVHNGEFGKDKDEPNTPKTKSLSDLFNQKI